MKKERLFRIKPLVWEESHDSTSQSFSASVPGNTYYVRRNRQHYEEDGAWTAWKWTYCFDEYYDEGEEECASAKAGKEAAWQHWLARLETALEEV